MDENILGTVAGILTSIAAMPQLIKVLKSKNVNDLSWHMIAILVTGLSLWVWYGMIKNELPIIISNGFAVAVNLSLLICYFKFRNNK
jgi:MtN3 and saliva related transmembrane protein